MRAPRKSASKRTREDPELPRTPGKIPVFAYSSDAGVHHRTCPSPGSPCARFLPGSTVEDSKLQDVLIAEGCRVRKAEITHSIVGIRSQISEGTVIRDSILMGADYYTPKRHPEVPIGIGRNCHIESAILDKNVQIGDGVVIKPFTNSKDLDHELYSVRDGIVVIAKDTLIPSGTCIEPK